MYGDITRPLLSEIPGPRLPLLGETQLELFGSEEIDQFVFDDPDLTPVEPLSALFMQTIEEMPAVSRNQDYGTLNNTFSIHLEETLTPAEQETKKGTPSKV